MCITSLPNELLCEIFNYSNLKTANELLCVNKQFNKIISEDTQISINIKSIKIISHKFNYCDFLHSNVNMVYVESKTLSTICLSNFIKEFNKNYVYPCIILI